MTPADLAARVPGYTQAELDAAYEAALQSIDDYLGPAGLVSELLDSGPGDLLMLSRPADGISTLVENDITLASNDYELRPAGQLVRRLKTGTHPASRWRGRIDVSYLPLSGTETRDRVALALMKLDLGYAPGITSAQLGEWKEERGSNAAWNYEEERRTILATLTDGLVML